MTRSTGRSPPRRTRWTARRSGRYYAAVVIPAGFSKDMLTFYSRTCSARIVYYANEKKSAIAPKITDQGADSVSYQVNEVFAQTLSEVAPGHRQSMSAYADEADVGGRIAGVSGKVRDMGAQAERMASVLELYSSLAGAAQTLASDSGKLVVAAQNGVDGLDAASSQGSTSASDLVAAVKGSVDDLAGALDGAAARFDEVSASAGALFDAASTGARRRGRAAGQAEAVDAQIARSAAPQSSSRSCEARCFRCPAGARRRHRAHERRRLAHGGHARQQAPQPEAGGWKR
ncbi:MAG: YhgE/Pip domain-containing protein [Eggerthellaceae bacterium]